MITEERGIHFFRKIRHLVSKGTAGLSYIDTYAALVITASLTEPSFYNLTQWFPTGVPRHTRVPRIGVRGAANHYKS